MGVLFIFLSIFFIHFAYTVFSDKYYDPFDFFGLLVFGILTAIIGVGLAITYI